MEYILSLDQGSTYSKAGLVDPLGRLVRSYALPLQTFRPKPMWVEHRPEDILKSQIAAAKILLESLGKKRDSITAVGLSSQRSTIMVWDKATGLPVAPALSWQDLRAEGEMEKFSEYRGLIRTKTGLLLSPYYAALKLRWILKHVPGTHRKAEKGELLCGTINTFLLWHLSKGEVHATDPTHAARMLLMNLQRLRWDHKLLSLFEIPESLLPKIQPSVSDFGDIQIGGRKIPVRACIGDQQAALVGLGAVGKGECVINYGTGGFLVVNTGSQVIRLPGLLTSLAWSSPKEKVYALEGTVNSVGTLFEWMMRMGIISSLKDISSMIRSSKHRSYLVPALAGLGAPHWNNSIQLGALGMGPWTTKADIVRAGVEGIAYLIKDIYEVLGKEKTLKIKVVRASGGVSKLDELLQIQADLLGVPIQRSHVPETTLLGTGFLAGLGCGWWKSPTRFPKLKTGRLFKPRIFSLERERLYRRWKRAFHSVQSFGKD